MSANKESNTVNNTTSSPSVVSKGTNILQNFELIHRTTPFNTALFDPTVYFRDMGLCDNIPTLLQLLGTTGVDLNARGVTYQGTYNYVSFTLGQSILEFADTQPKLRLFYTTRESESQQLLLQFNSVANSTEPMRAYRNAMPRTVMTLSAIFARQENFNMQYRSYFFAPYMMFLAWQYNYIALGGQPFSVVGLGALAADAAAGNLGRIMETYYPVLWSGYNPVTDPGYVQGVAIWTLNALGKELLLVLVNESQYDMAMINVVAAIPVTPPFAMWEELFSQFVPAKDGKMILALNWQAYSEWNGIAAQMSTQLTPQTAYSRYVPHYDFLDHVAWWETEGKTSWGVRNLPEQIPASVQGVRAVLASVWNMNATRTFDFYAFDWTTPGFPPKLRLRMDPFSEPLRNARDCNTTIHLTYFMPPALFSFFTKMKLCCPQYVIADNVYSYTQAGAAIKIVYHKKDEQGRPYFSPVYKYGNNEIWVPGNPPHASGTSWNNGWIFNYPNIFFRGNDTAGWRSMPALLPIPRNNQALFKKPAYIHVTNALNYNYVLEPLINDSDPMVTAVNDPDYGGWSFLG